MYKALGKSNNGTINRCINEMKCRCGNYISVDFRSTVRLPICEMHSNRKFMQISALEQ